MRILKLSAVLVIAMLLTGCVPSLHPLYTEKDAVFDRALLGSWTEEGSGDRWVFKEGKKKAYDLTVTSEGESAKFKAHLVRLGKTLFLDIYPEKPEKIEQILYLAHLIPAHTFWRVELEGDDLSMQLLSMEWLQSMIEEKKIEIKHAVVDEGIILTAPTKDLQKMLEKYADAEGAFIGPDELFLMD